MVALFERIWPKRWAAYERLRGIFERPWRTLAVVGVLHTAGWATFDWREVPIVGDWVPDATLLLYYWGCYLLGWMVFQAKPDLSALRKHGWRMLWASIALAQGKWVAMLPLLKRTWTPELPFPDDLAWTWPIIVGPGAISGVALSMGLAGVFPLCWWSYLALVRSSAIGVCLNGRRYPSPRPPRALRPLQRVLSSEAARSPHPVHRGRFPR